MIKQDFAEQFAKEWIEAWNSHDLDRILSHYSKDFQLSSPFIAQVIGEPSGTLKGIAAVREYWRVALARRSDLHFELVSLLVGVASIVIVYDRHDGRLGAEYFEFEESGMVIRSSAHYTG
jgi:ketosteroid isomerase-like protein